MYYVDFILPVLAAFIIVAIISPAAIPALHRLKFGQEVRDDGPKTHLKKQGTPTMGGVIFLFAIEVVGFLYAKNYPKIIPILLLTLGFGIVGFIDDYLKVVKHQSEGLNPKQKFLLQLIFTVIFSIYIYKSSDYKIWMYIPFTDYVLDLKKIWIFVPAVSFVILATDNGANFTDGLDGLCSSVTGVIALFIMIVSIAFHRGEIAPIAGAVFGALMGFLIFNAYPARVFMGDTGSLALGGFVASSAIIMQMPLFIPIFAFIYFLEVLSVIIQVGYFKHTHGKRIFKMAPIHHHFELCGWSETKVVAVFTVITVILCFTSVLALIP